MSEYGTKHLAHGGRQLRCRMHPTVAAPRHSALEHAGRGPASHNVPGADRNLTRMSKLRGSSADLLTKWIMARTIAAVDRLAPVRRLWTPFLVLWFAGQTYGRISTFARNQVPLGLDARIYYRAVTNWVAGVDPWRAAVVFNHHTFSYAGTPATVVLMAPVVLLSEDAFTGLWLAITALSAVWIVRRLRLPYWWLLFPPLTEILYSGNPQMVVLALLLIGGSWASATGSALSIGLKVYAIAPVLGERRYRDAALGVGVTAASVLVAPGLWLAYLREFGTISARLAHESDKGFSAFYYPLLLLPVALLILVLVLRDRRSAGWLAIPALWPASEFHYSTFALPVMSPLLAVLLAIPSQQLPPVAIGLEVMRRLLAAPVRAKFERARAASEFKRSQAPSSAP
jgi:hypothetical protein